MPPPSTERQLRLEALRAKAPLAAQYEDCIQATVRLTDALQANLAGSGPIHHLAADCRSRVKLWGDDSGACSRRLDYVLKSSPKLLQQTKILLEDLQGVLEQAISGAQPHDAEVVESRTGPRRADTISSLADNLGDADRDEQEQEPELEPERFLEEALDIISCLTRLLPTLLDPLEETDEPETRDVETDRHSANWYFELAEDMFSGADQTLLMRLAEENVRRRRHLARLRERAKLVVGGVDKGRLGSLAPLRLPLRRTRTESTNAKNAGYYQSPPSYSDAVTTTSSSYADTGRTKTTRADGTSATSLADSHHPAIMHRLVPPQPPVSLPRAEPFDCSLCHFDLPLAVTDEPMDAGAWATHVYLDLSPYLCTFGNCSRESRPFDNRRDWFQHELDCHRSPMVWYCGICRFDFDTADAFTNHLKPCHAGLSLRDPSLIADSCKRFSQEPQQPPLCPLCQQTCLGMEELETHLGGHLETFALAATLDLEPYDDEEEVHIEGMLSDYLAEQNASSDAEHDLPRVGVSTIRALSPGLPPEPQSAIMDTSDISHPDDILMEAPKPKDEVLLYEKVKTFLEHQILAPPSAPVRSNVPSRNENFVGRIQDMQELHKALSTPGKVCTVSGRGGIGKTSVAAEYLYRYNTEYSYVFWVQAESPGTCAEQYNQITECLDLGEKSLPDGQARTFLVRECLAKMESRWLLIFDNVPLWEDIARYIPRMLGKSNGSVLVTTRAGPFPSFPPWYSQYPVRLEVWPLEESREFLLTSIQPKLNKEALKDHEEFDLAGKVVEIVGRLPLAVSMVAGYIRVSKTTLADFMEMWAAKEAREAKRRKKTIVTTKDGSIDATIDSLWAIGMREVPNIARCLLDVLSFLDPDSIPKKLLVGDHDEEYLEFLDASEEKSISRMIHQLSGRRLISVRQGSDDEFIFSIHRLLQDKILVDMVDYSFEDACRRAYRLIRKKFPRAEPTQVPVQADWEKCREYMPHVFSFHHVFKQSPRIMSLRDPRPEDIAELFYDAGFYVWARQTPAYDGLSFLETASIILDKIAWDPYAKIRADIHCMTGLLLLNMGCSERVRGAHHLQTALRIRERNFEEKDSYNNDVLLRNAANDYSLALLNDHQYDEAKGIWQKCYERYQVWGPEQDHPFEYSKYWGQISIVYLWENRIDEAIAAIKRCLELTERFAGKRGQYLRRKYLLACILLQAGDVAGAVDMHFETLNARLESHGKHHESTILSMYSLGAAYHQLGPDHLNEAIEYMKQSVEQGKRAKWSKEALGRARWHLAMLYREKPDATESELIQADWLENEARVVLNECRAFTADCVRWSDNELMIFDDMQPTFQGRYTGRALLKHLQSCLM